jgi:hypothetical protein
MPSNLPPKQKLQEKAILDFFYEEHEQKSNK